MVAEISRDQKKEKHMHKCFKVKRSWGKKELVTGADPGFGVRGDEIRQGDLRVLLLLSQMFTERMMQEN